MLSVTGNTSIANINPIRYRGYYYDTETQLYYLNSRYYDPDTCRFINADDFAFVISPDICNNIFSYCNNCPVTYSDKIGTSAMALCTSVIVARSAFNIALKALTKVSWCLWLALIALAVLLAAVVALILLCKQFMDNARQAIEEQDELRKNKKKTETNNSTIYFLSKEEGSLEDVFYVGRTTDFDKRMSTHANQKGKYNKTPFFPYIYKTGLDKDEARVYEQALISAFTMDKMARVVENNGMSNRIRGISKKKLKNFIKQIKKIIELQECKTENELLSFMER